MARVPPPKRRQVAYGMAKRADPVGRLSDKDVQFQSRRLRKKEEEKTYKDANGRLRYMSGKLVFPYSKK